MIMLLMAVPTSACDRIAISGATVGQTNRMGTYTKVAGQLNDGKPVCQIFSLTLQISR